EKAEVKANADTGNGTVKPITGRIGHQIDKPIRDEIPTVKTLQTTETISQWKMRVMIVLFREKLDFITFPLMRTVRKI
ncbi:MAG: hypothetical protein ACFBSE_02755, partial [Prochloraceae cyanobacterium]